MAAKAFNPVAASAAFEHKRDAYGFAVRPQHVQRYREYAAIYKEEEEERSDRWISFLQRQADESFLDVSSTAESDNISPHDIPTNLGDGPNEVGSPIGHPAEGYSSRENVTENVVPEATEKQVHRVQLWTEIRPSLQAIEEMMSRRIKKTNVLKHLAEPGNLSTNSSIPSVEESLSPNGAEEDSEDEFYDVERSDSLQDVPLSGSPSASSAGVNEEKVHPEASFPWKEELECLVQGGVPMALRGELWQAFVGVRARRKEKYYQELLSQESSLPKQGVKQEQRTDNNHNDSPIHIVSVPEKWKGQIEKDLPRTFPGHPALDEDGRNALRRLLTAYARHNPSVGYCQAMNFFAGILLLLMPEENAFWTLVGIIDDYFDGYYSEEMIESQVDQLVFEELVYERFPKLVNHLDYLGVQIAWVTGPWFLSIFMNMLPWESVLRVWDVLLYEGNRVMLFRTALALIELYGPALVTTKDAGDAVTLLQSLAGSTFDSSQLVLTACMGYQNVNEVRLQELREKHRPSVMAAIEERARGLKRMDSNGLASKLYNFKQDPGSLMLNTNGDIKLGNDDACHSECLIGMTGDAGVDSAPDYKEQIVWLKVQLSKLLEDKRSAELRSEELETALMEMVKQDNRRQLSARVEQLEQEVAELRHLLSDKQEQEHAMLQVFIRVEQEQRLTEDARRYAEQEAAAQRHESEVLQRKYEDSVASLEQLEKRAVMAESMLEATLQYQSGQLKTQSSPRYAPVDSSPEGSNQEAVQEVPPRKLTLLSRPFGLSWGDRNKSKGESAVEGNGKSAHDPQSPSNERKDKDEPQLTDKQ
uniref:Rab-GAP TBC domain-containing protein n=1 Tax=Kalanchoe fedtschenkoi TaxID=63787 RepID=A0A7N0TLL2_KALFE